VTANPEKNGNLKGLRFHDLRHSVASVLAKQNVPLLTIGKVLGHRSLESTKRYAHLIIDDLVPHVEMLGARLKRVK
jgi:integrase